MIDLRILFIEDSENDALLLIRAIQKGGYQAQWKRVETIPDIEAALASQQWDLILCDYFIPTLTPMQALEILKRNNLDLPFIIVSGAIQEEAAVSALKAGAHDFIVKNKLARLIPAIQREIREAENRREHKQADDSLRASELRFRNTLESMMEGCHIIGYDWRYLYLNAAAEKHNRQPNEELLGNVYMDIWPDIESTAVFTALQRCMNERTVHHLVTEFIYPDGVKGWFELDIQPSIDGIFILSSDITGHRQAEQALIERERKLSILFEILPVGISILDVERKVSYINPALKNMLDLSDEGLIKGDYGNSSYLRADGTPMPFDELATARAFREQTEINNVETGAIKKDGRIIWTNVSAVPVDFPDWKLVVVTTNITERKYAEMEILKLNAELEEKVAARTAELAVANEQLRQLLLFDELTGLYNRRGFLLLADEQLLLAQRTQRNLLVFYGDLDRLKKINDKFGHNAGDEALVMAARALNETFRTSDIKARLGGDEFIVLTIDAEEQGAQALLTRLHEKLATNNQSMSVGVVTFDAQKESSIEELIAYADEAMYIEKRKKPSRN